MIAMILAAGYGKRSRPLSLLRPKPLFPVLGRPVISLTLDLLAAAGADRFVVNTHHLADMVEGYLAESAADMNIRVLREKVILGTGGGLKNARAFLGAEPFFVANADIVTDLDPARIMADHLCRRPLATLALHDCPRFNNVTLDPDGLISGFRNRFKPSADPGSDRRLAFTGLYVLDPTVLDRIPPGPGDIIDTLLDLVEDDLPVRGTVFSKPAWSDLGTLTGYLELHKNLLAQKSGGRVMAAPGAVMENSATVDGWAFLDRETKVEAGARVRNSVLWPGARVLSGVSVRDSVVGDGVTVTEDLFGAALIGRPRA